MIDGLENYTDYTVFGIDNYGNASEDDIVKKYNPIDIIRNPKINDAFIKQLEKRLK